MKRGATKLKAKRALEATIETGEAAIHVPTVADTKALARDLQKAGVRAAREIDEGVNALQFNVVTPRDMARPRTSLI